MAEALSLIAALFIIAALILGFDWFERLARQFFDDALSDDSHGLGSADAESFNHANGDTL